MPKNKVGGKKFKKMKHNLEAAQRPLVIPEEEGQKIALVNKFLGNGRVSVTYENPGKGQIEALAIIRGTLRKRKQWVRVGNFILISEREFEKDKVDVIHVYNEGEMNTLKRKGLINNNLVKLSDSTNSHRKELKEDAEFTEFIEDDVEDEEENKSYKEDKTIVKKNNISIQDFGLPSFSDEEDEIDNI